MRGFFMPIFEFACESCQHRCEELLRMSDPLPVKCPKCGKESLKKQLSQVSFQLKGGGWYTDGYGKKSPVESKDKATAPVAETSSTGQNPAPAAAASTSTPPTTTASASPGNESQKNPVAPKSPT